MLATMRDFFERLFSPDMILTLFGVFLFAATFFLPLEWLPSSRVHGFVFGSAALMAGAYLRNRGKKKDEDDNE